MAGIVSVGTIDPRAGASLLLEVFVNGAPSGQVGEFREAGGRVFAAAQELRDLGFAVPARAAGDIDLAALPGIDYRVDASAQQIFFTAAIDALATHRIAIGGGTRSLTQAGGTGFLVNYDAVATAGRHGTSASALFEARATHGYLSASTRSLVDAGRGGFGFRRLDSRIDYADVSRLRRFSAGDIVSSALAWTRPVRMAGVQAATAFEMRPDLITSPLPTIQGKAAVASTVDVLVNGVRQLSESVPAGPFSIPQLPITGGAGTVSVEIRDALGRVSRMEMSAYASDAMLATGLTSVSIELGAIRTGFGSSGDAYGPLAAALSYRRGLRGITIEAHAEGAGALASIGVGAALNLGHLAVATVAGSASSYEGQWGKSGYFAVERQTRSYRLGVSAHYAGGRFRDLPAIAGDPAPRLYVQANGGASLGEYGAIDLGYLRADAKKSDPSASLPALLPSATRAYGVSTGTMSYSRAVGGRYLFSASAFRDFHRGSSGVMANLSISFGRRIQASGSASAMAGRTLAGIGVRQIGSEPGELAWDSYAGRDPKPRGFVQGGMRTAIGQFGAGVDYANGAALVRASASGSLVLTEGRLLAANPVRDSFALVETGLAGLRVLQDNRPMGRTGRDGRLLLTDLRGFDGNRIEIDVEDLPVDAQLDSSELVLRPSERAGLLARFPIRRMRSVLLTLVDRAGLPIEVGAAARLGDATSGSSGGQGASEPVGYDGKLFLQGVSAHNRLTVLLSDGKSCSLTFDAPATEGAIPELGPLVCASA